jgi:hypothetical protein
VPTLKQLETALINADKAGDEEGARVLAAEIKRMQAQLAPKASRTEAVVSGISRGIKPTFDLLDVLPQSKGQAALERRVADIAGQAQQARPNYFTGGQIAGEIAATAPLVTLGGAGIAAAGRGLGAVAPRVGAAVERFGQSVSTGGLGTGRTAQQTARMTKTQRAAQLAERAAGGATGGAAAAALSDQDAAAGAAFGAGLPVVGTILRKTGGKVVDLTRLPRLQAAQIIRESLGANEDAARAAFAALSPDDQRLARQVLVDAGVEPRVFMGIGADVERLRPNEVGGVLQQQAAAREARLAQAAGGRTATETRAAAEVGRRDVSRATGPLRTEALGRANVAGREVPAAEQLAALARAQADEQSGLARRMTFGAERAETRLGQMDDLGDTFNPAAVGRERGIAGAMTQRGEQAALGAIGLRQSARDMEDYVADLAAQGMQPLRVAPIVQQIRSMAAQPGTRADDLQRGTLTKLANKLEGLADANGVIDARDLYQLRKTGLNDIVDRLLGARAQPSSGTKERTASLLTSIRPMIDDAIEQAGGSNWRDYIDRTRLGFEAVNRQELAAKAAQMGKEKPDELIALMAGERPKVVEDIMGTRQYDIGGMALADPQRYLALQQSANELGTLNRMTELGREGSAAASALIGRERPLLARNLTRMGLAPFPPVRIGADAAQMALANTLAPRVRDELATSFLSGQNSLALMNQYPASLTASETISNLPVGLRNAIAQAMNRYLQQ